jgi:hypothetical protein
VLQKTATPVTVDERQAQETCEISGPDLRAASRRWRSLKVSRRATEIEISTLIVKPVASAEEQPHRLEEVTVAERQAQEACGIYGPDVRAASRK